MPQKSLPDIALFICLTSYHTTLLPTVFINLEIISGKHKTAPPSLIGLFCLFLPQAILFAYPTRNHGWLPSAFRSYVSHLLQDVFLTPFPSKVAIPNLIYSLSYHCLIQLLHSTLFTCEIIFFIHLFVVYILKKKQIPCLLFHHCAFNMQNNAW